MNPRRSASVGALPREKKHFTSRNESSGGISLDVRCACQYFQCDTLLPERVNPLDSRPSSKLEYYSDVSNVSRQQMSSGDQLHLANINATLQSDNLSTKSFNIAPCRPIDFDRVSMRSFGGQRTCDAKPEIDLSFVEKYPELEDAIRSRGLVVRTISESTTEIDHGHRRTFFGQMRDPDTVSVKSVTSLRRISRSPSKADLFVAEINIPSSNVELGQSISRRGSHLDLTRIGSNTTIQMTPQLNIIAPTPSPGISEMAPNFNYSQRQQYQPIMNRVLPQFENKENLPIQSAVLPQNRPIDLSQYMESEETSTKPMELRSQDDELSTFVAHLEDIAATTYVVDIVDKIKTQTEEPPMSIVFDKQDSHIDQETKIEITCISPEQCVENVIQVEDTKPTPCQWDTLQLPSTNRLKRPFTQEEEQSPEILKKSAIDTSINIKPQSLSHPEGMISLEYASPEAKSTYSARFKSFFHKKGSDKDNKEASVSLENRDNSPQLSVREKSPSPSILKSSFRVPLKFKSTLVKSEPTSMQPQHYSESSNINQQSKGKDIHTVKVTESFSLKVDDMDQYSCKPMPPQSPRNKSGITHSLLTSTENMQSMVETDFAEPFAPLVLPSGTRPIQKQFLAGMRTLAMYSSQTDIQSERSEIDMLDMGGELLTQPIHGILQSKLFSEPIHLPEHQAAPNETETIEVRNLPYRRNSQTSLPRVTSEHRLLQSKLVRSRSFLNGRTHSQERAENDNYRGDFEQMAKTVSFNFNERQSRLSEISQKTATDQQNWLERTYFSRDHEYEPIGQPPSEGKTISSKEPSPVPDYPTTSKEETSKESITELPHDEQVQFDGMAQAEELQRELEERYLSSPTQTPLTEPHDDNEQLSSEINSSALNELPSEAGIHKKSFIASAQDKTRRMQAGFKNQAGKIKMRLRSPKKVPSGSPKAKDRKRFKAPEFSKLKMPDIKRPELPKFKSPDMSKFKRPDFTKFSKPDMSKFKLPEKFNSLKLTRSKSFKEPESSTMDDGSGLTPASGPIEELKSINSSPQKKKFEFNFGTYPRAFRKKKKITEPEVIQRIGSNAEERSVIPSTETQQSLESSCSQQGDRGPGPVRSRWADKFSDVSFNDSESSRYRRYGSEQESFDRESSLERRMKEDLEEQRTDDSDHGILSGGVQNKQFEEFDEENRAIHEISKIRASEFKRRPIVHQDSDLISEESKDVVGWTEKEVQKNKLLRQAELESELNYKKYPSEEGLTGSVNTNQETISTASSGGKKLVMEEIDDDEFFLRTRGASEEDIELREYIRTAIREGFDVPLNALKLVGEESEQLEHEGYDVPPPKPRRLNHYKNYEPDFLKHFEENRYAYDDDNMSLSQTGSDYIRAPSRPLRKGRSRSKFSVESQEIPNMELHRKDHYFSGEEYLRESDDQSLNRSDINAPQVPRRRKKVQRDSVEKDSYINGFSGRSVSNSFLQPHEDVIVYRTEHAYQIPLATPETYTDVASTTSRKSKSLSRFGGIDEDDRTSRGAESLSTDIMLREENMREKFVIDMMENDGYAVVRKSNVPKPTPPARRKKFSRSPGERFVTLPHIRKQKSPAPERPPPPRNYSSTMVDRPTPPRRKSAYSLDNAQNFDENPHYDDSEEPELSDRPDSPKNLQSGEIINKMKYRPLPPPPRPPREKRLRSGSRDRQDEEDSEYSHRDDGVEDRIIMVSSEGSYEHDREFEVEVSTQTDPLPDDFICEEFEITDDMKVIEPTCTTTINDFMKNSTETSEQLEENELLAKGLQRFRDANQRSLSEKSRASSHSRPHTPSAVVIERRIPTPVPNSTNETVLQASLTVQPIELDLEDELLRRKELEEEVPYGKKEYCDDELISKSDTENQYEEDEEKNAFREPNSMEFEPAIQDLNSKSEDGTIDSQITVNQNQDFECERQELSLDFKDDQKETDKFLTDHEYELDGVIKAPSPPPRKRSATIDLVQDSALPIELPTAVATTSSEMTQNLPSRMAVIDLEVERLRVHALQAGQIMVSQLHGVQINADELECKSGNLVVKNIEFPEGFIEEIVERVRNTERCQLHAAETQTSLQTSLSEGIETLASEEPKHITPQDISKPDGADVSPTQLFQPKESALPTAEQPNNNEQKTSLLLSAHQKGFVPVEYLESFSPLAFYNLQGSNEPATHLRSRRHHRHRHYSSSSEDGDRRRKRCERAQETQTVSQAGMQFITACNASLINIINQLTNSLRPSVCTDRDRKETGVLQSRNVSALVAAFILITFGVLIFLLSGKNVHHHHWDYFNPPGNDGRSS